MRRLRGLVRTARGSAAVVYPSLALARVAFGATRPRPGRPGSGGGPRVHVLLAPPGGGNIGDQAMVDAFVENVVGPVRVLVTADDALSVAGLPAGRVERVTVPDLVYGTRLAAHLRDVRAFRSLLDDAASFSVLGADTMDGAYNVRASLRRALLVHLAARAGVDTRVLGFSWNARPHPAARRLLRRASRSGAALLLRDPRSAARARADGLHGVSGVADTVFRLTATDGAVAEEHLADAGDRRVALVNVSALVGRSVDQTAEYARVVRHLLAVGWQVVLVPHVSRPGADDVEACRRVRDAVAGDAAPTGALTVVDRLLTPAGIRGLCARSDVVVTGRMHLAVMALSLGVPAVTLATQGKVEGLAELVGVPELCVVPEPGMGEEVIRLVERIVPGDGDVVQRVRAALPEVHRLAAANFAGLGPAGPDAEVGRPGAAPTRSTALGAPGASPAGPWAGDDVAAAPAGSPVERTARVP